MISPDKPHREKHGSPQRSNVNLRAAKPVIPLVYDVHLLLALLSARTLASSRQFCERVSIDVSALQNIGCANGSGSLRQTDRDARTIANQPRTQSSVSDAADKEAKALGRRFRLFRRSTLLHCIGQMRKELIHFGCSAKCGATRADNLFETH